MASIRSICIIPFFLLVTIHAVASLYEDQVGKFDWKRSFVGKVIFSSFDTKRVIVATEDNVLASLSVKTGHIQWRQVMENQKEQSIRLLHVDKEIVTISGAQNVFYVRLWESSTGILLSSWVLNSQRPLPCEFIVNKDKLYHVVPISTSHVEVTSYQLSSGETKAKTTKVPAPWIRNPSSCIVTSPYYVCTSTEDSSGQLYYINLLEPGSSVQAKPIQSLIGDGLGRVMLIEYKDRVPSLLIVRNNEAKLVVIEDGDVQVKPFSLMPNAIGVDSLKPLIYQLEASDDPRKLIKVKAKDAVDGKDEFSLDLEYPVGLGAPIILDGQTTSSITDLLLTTTDNALLLVRLPEGKILWTKEEALSNIVATEFFELPVSELDASIEHEFDPSEGIVSMFLHRITTQTKQLSNLIFGDQLLSGKGLVRDEFGLHKIIVVATKVGKLFALDTMSGSIAWSYRLPNVKPFEEMEEKMLLFVQRTARYAPLPAQCVLVAEDAITGNAVMFEFDPITGNSSKGLEKLGYKPKQILMLPHANENYVKPIVIVSDSDEVYVYPKSGVNVLKNHFATTHLYTLDADKGLLNGHNFKYSSENKLTIFKTWTVNLAPSKIVAITARPQNERVHSQGRVMYDRSVYYKYVNPNMIAVATVTPDPVHKHVLSVYLIDGVTGFVVYSTTHRRSRGPVHIIHSENWLVYTYFNERFRRTEVAAAELYEGSVQSNSTVFSSLAISQLPQVEKQAYILPAIPTTMAVTITERGITNKCLLLGLSSGSVIEIPWLLLQPRFENVPCGPEESCIPYMPEIPLAFEAIINYNQTLSRVKGIEIAPARLESTSHVLVHGLDIFYTRVAPSKTFDVLKEDFDHRLIVVVLTGLVVASYVTKYLASRKALKQAWK